MAPAELRQRPLPASVPDIANLKAHRLQAALESKPDKREMPEAPKSDNVQLPSQPTAHPRGEIKHGAFTQAIRMSLFALCFSASILAIAVTQYVGLPLYFYSKDWFYAWMAVTKQHFGIVMTTMTYWWAPVTMRISGDESVRGQLSKTKDGRLQADFPERMVLISNHQIYTDWVHLWWIAYTGNMHGHIYIILKESIKHIPILGTGMMLYGFIFLSRKWATDQERFKYRLKKLTTSHNGPLSGSKGLDPMWLLIFPEGTNLSRNGRAASKKWADKNHIQDLRHALLPRSTGLSFCLNQLEESVEYMYDCTLAYEGVPVGHYGQDIYTLRSTYFQGRQPKSVNMHWRRFRIADIPVHDEAAFADWLLARWREKDDLLQYFVENQRFPADEGWIETEVRTRGLLEWIPIFVPVATLALLANVLLKVANLLRKVAKLD